MNTQTNKPKIAIVGAGVAGSTTAITLGNLGLDITLFEKEKSLINGPPFCHLHAGGNLYREISDAQCITLLKQSISFLRFYPFIVDYRPTVIALPLSDKSTPETLLPRLQRLSQEYQSLILQDPKNEVLGKSNTYFRCYTKAQLVQLKQKEPVLTPTQADEWMIPVAKYIDLENIQFPLIIVQEYGLNLFRLAAGTALHLKTLPSVTMNTHTIVQNITKNSSNEKWDLTYKKDNKLHHETFDYLINAAGFRSGKIDDMVKAPCKAMVEFKAAYVSQWEALPLTRFPEIIFHGERGTPQGMGQFTPYPNGYFQLHAMTQDITLYKDGLVSNSSLSCQANLGKNFIDKIEKSWSQEETTQRTQAAIQHLAQFIPKFSSATVGSKPLFGAQQIPGDDPTLRVAEVSFPLANYARCEIVKVSSSLDMAKAITADLQTLGYLKNTTSVLTHFNSPKESEIHVLAQDIAKEREYPKALAMRTSKLSQ